MLKTLRARFMPGQNVSGYAEAAKILAGTFVKVSAGTTGGEYQIVKCGAGDLAFGVSESDSGDPSAQAAESVELRVNVVRPGAIARVVPGAALTAGQLVQSDANGYAIPKGADAQASLNTGVVGSNNAITWKARQLGTPGNAVTVTLVDPGGTTAALAVTVAGSAITVSLARASSALTSTAQNVIDAIQANGEASDLVTVASTSTSNGTGIAAAVATTPLAGGTNAGAGWTLGQCMADAASDDAFAEIALFVGGYST